MTLEQLSELIETEIESLSWKNKPANLYEPIAYILSLGGKRMRPLLVLLGYSLFRSDAKSAVKPALAVEVFHNFSLMHDDIMDRAPIRRGQPTVHEKWNETVAILSGDTMLVKAYELLAMVPAKHLPVALQKFNTCAIEVCEGQQLDMNFQDREDVTKEEYLEMIRLKTAVLLGFSLELGGLLADQPEEVQLRLKNLGVSLGMAFQLMDDHLDTFGKEENFGKQIGGDILANKKTFLLLEALNVAKGHANEMLQEWLENNAEPELKINEVTKIYKDCNVDEVSKEKIFEYGELAMKLLSELDGDDQIKSLLKGYIDKLNQRVV